jgi:glycerophosphoryl diester phosphodiesterase
MATYQKTNGPIILAHRGGGGEATENTLQAFQHAIDLGCTHMETDVRVDKDGRLFLTHDASSPFPNRPLKNSRTKGLTTLDELFNAFPNACFSIDPKHDLAVKPLAELILQRNMVDKVCIGSSFDYRTAKVASIIEEKCGKRPCTALVSATALGKLLTNLSALRRVKDKLGASYINIPLKLTTARNIRIAHELDLKVITWILNDQDEIISKLHLGIDGFMTDYPTVALRAVGSESK